MNDQIKSAGHTMFDCLCIVMAFAACAAGGVGVLGTLGFWTWKLFEAMFGGAMNGAR